MIMIVGVVLQSAAQSIGMFIAARLVFTSKFFVEGERSNVLEPILN
jgi:hypothetical protein